LSFATGTTVTVHALSAVGRSLSRRTVCRPAVPSNRLNGLVGALSSTPFTAIR
jgi:hypothetical protein